MPTYIPDGYTESAYLAGVPRLYGELRFTYRPALVEEGAEFISSLAGLKGKEIERRSAAFVAGKLVSWDLKLGDELAAVSAQNLLRLSPKLYQRVVSVVLGSEAPDDDPQAASAQGEAVARDSFRGAANGPDLRAVPAGAAGQKPGPGSFAGAVSS